jgi:hypothetical protein
MGNPLSQSSKLPEWASGKDLRHKQNPLLWVHLRTRDASGWPRSLLNFLRGFPDAGLNSVCHPGWDTRRIAGLPSLGYLRRRGAILLSPRDNGWIHPENRRAQCCAARAFAPFFVTTFVSAETQMHLFLRTARLRNRLDQLMYRFRNRKGRVFNSVHLKVNT